MKVKIQDLTGIWNQIWIRFLLDRTFEHQICSLRFES